MKILFTCVGRRVELLQAFRSAADRLQLDLCICGTDVTTTAPALFFCDRQIQMCRIDNGEYIPQLLEVCEKECIDALIPTIDTDLLLLAQNKHAFAKSGTKVIVSDAEQIRLCRDKRLTSSFFVQCGLNTPMPTDNMDQYKGGFPCFIKPLNGSSSINAFKVNNQADLEAYAKRIFDFIIQPYIEGTEYTVDIFCDFEGQPVYITPRERLAVRSGEVLKTRIAQDERIIDECRKLIDQFKPCGAITVQLIRQRGTGEDYFIEINPRFGGGTPLSMKAGADAAGALLGQLKGDHVAYQTMAAMDGAVYSRYDQSVCVQQGEHEREAEREYRRDRKPERIRNNELYSKPVCKPEIKAVIFDLDDTLYSEKDYVRSGYRAVAELLPQIPDAYEKLWAAFEAGRPAIDAVLYEAGIYTDELKKHCLNAYRTHMPDIRLYDGISELLVELRGRGVKTGLLTDGRPEGQRAKIQALGLESLVDEIIITDELGGSMFRKPNDIAFRVMQCRLNVPYENMVYIGDNIQKDFLAPRMLGMQSFWFQNEDGLYIFRTGDGVGFSNIAEIYNSLMRRSTSEKSVVCQ